MDLEWGPRFCGSSKLPDDIIVAGPLSTLGIARVEDKKDWKIQIAKFLPLSKVAVNYRILSN